MPLRALAIEMTDQHEIERGRLAEMLDDRMVVIERAQRALRENRIEEICLDANGLFEAILQVGGLVKLRKALTMAHACANSSENPEARAVLLGSGHGADHPALTFNQLALS